MLLVSLRASASMLPVCLRTMDNVTVAPWPWIYGGARGPVGLGFSVFPSLAADPAENQACAVMAR